MEPVTSVALQQFLQRLGKQFSHPAKLYLLGGSALRLLGSPRETLDVDYSLETPSVEIEKILKQLSSKLRLDLELEEHFKSILPRAKKAEIDPKEFETYFNTLKKRMG